MYITALFLFLLGIIYIYMITIDGYAIYVKPYNSIGSCVLEVKISCPYQIKSLTRNRYSHHLIYVRYGICSFCGNSKGLFCSKSE